MFSYLVLKKIKIISNKNSENKNWEGTVPPFHRHPQTPWVRPCLYLLYCWTSYYYKTSSAADCKRERHLSGPGSCISTYLQNRCSTPETRVNTDIFWYVSQDSFCGMLLSLLWDFSWLSPLWMLHRKQPNYVVASRKMLQMMICR